MYMISIYRPIVRTLPSIAAILPLLFLGGCERAGSSQSDSGAPISSTTPAVQPCKFDVVELRRLRDEVSKSPGASTGEDLSRSGEALQRWMEKCSSNAAEFDRIAVSGLWNRLGQAWAAKGEYETADNAFAQALSLLRVLPQSEELLIALRGKADCEWNLGRHAEGSALAKEQLNTARTMYKGSASTQHYLVDALEFAAKFAGMEGNNGESVQLTSEAKKLSELIEGTRTTNSIPGLPAAQ